MNEYHILSLSGGKDSTALAFFMKETYPEIWDNLELVFCDTECEIPETYDYLNKIELFLNKKITRIKPEKSFDHIYQIYNQIPSPIKRWCTVELKTKPFRRYLKEKYSNAVVNLYIGIRADETQRLSTVKNTNTLKECHPFIEYNICKKDIYEILDSYGVGLPDYYQWSNRSGCYFCPFQTKMNWINLYKHHPDLYKKAMSYEFKKGEGRKNSNIGWIIGMSLEELIQPKTMRIIEQKHNTKTKQIALKKLVEIF